MLYRRSETVATAATGIDQQQLLLFRREIEDTALRFFEMNIKAGVKTRSAIDAIVMVMIHTSLLANKIAPVKPAVFAEYITELVVRMQNEEHLSGRNANH